MGKTRQPHQGSKAVILQNQNIPQSSFRPLLTMAILVALGFLLGPLITPFIPGALPNHAEEVAKPLEKSLAAKGAVKKCGYGDSGHGWDNDRPWYYAVYETPTGQQNAVDVLNEAARQTGFNLTVGAQPANPKDNKFYTDRTSKQSPYSDLREGKIYLDATVFGSGIYNGEQGGFCGVTETASPVNDRTTVKIEISLPRVKR